MSKYIYATVYEQFTGLKPPEPKSNKPRRRRGYGHPYRMRLNIQDEDQQEQEALLESDDHFESAQEIQPVDDDFDSQAHFLPNMTMNSQPKHDERNHHRKKSHYSARRNDQQRIVNYPPIAVEETSKGDKQPKVTYKKRRCLTAATA